MSLLTTHVIDTARGVPAAGIAIDLYRVSRGERCHVRSLTANVGGRFDEPHHVPLFLSPFSYTVYRGS